MLFVLVLSYHFVLDHVPLPYVWAEQELSVQFEFLTPCENMCLTDDDHSTLEFFKRYSNQSALLLKKSNRELPWLVSIQETVDRAEAAIVQV